jgi:tetratricopeptide (TPR) repeat protein
VDGIWNKPKLWICICLAVATLAVYAQVYRHEFIDLDDSDYVFENWHVASGLNWHNAAWAFTTGHAANWHPLTWLSHMVDCQIFGLNPGPQHLVNVLLHITNALLLFLILQNLTGAQWKSAFVAALFALHPLHVESVAWIAERKDVLSTLFWFLTLWAYMGYVRRSGLNRYLLTLLLFALGLMAKPMLVTLPFVLLLLDFWPLNRFAPAPQAGTRDARRATRSLAGRFWRPALPLVREKIPFFLLAAASSIITFAVQKAGGAVQTIDLLLPSTRIANAIHSYVAYLLKATWPSDLSVFYRYQSAGYPIYEIALAAFLLLCITALALQMARRAPYLAVGWFWYLGTLVPVIGLVQIGGQSMADRYTYVPLTGIFVVIAWGAPDLAAKWSAAKKPLATAAAFLLLACSVTTWHQVRYWQDTISLSLHAVEIDKDSYMAHEILGLGAAFASQGRTLDAIHNFERALQINPNYAEAHNNLGNVLLQQGQIDKALSHYTEALRLNPKYAEAHYNMAVILYGQGKIAEAITHYREAIRLRPDYVDAFYNLAAALDGQGDFQGAVANYSEAIRLKPDFVEAYNNLGVTLFNHGQVQKALDAFSQALRVKPDNADARRNRDAILNGLGRSKRTP